MSTPRTYRQPTRPHAGKLVRQSDGDVWEADVLVQLSRSPTWTVTDHPVEDGVTVSDHIQRQPDTITADVVLTENPTRQGGETGGAAHVQKLLAWLFDTANSDAPLVDVVVPRLGVFTGYAITGLPHTLDGVSRLAFTITLRELRIATATLVSITVEDTGTTDKATAAGAPDEVDVGEQATTASDSEEDRSALASLLDSL